ncbi:MAG: single-stranded DNA-binding protein [Kiritimatiellae bacterium]|nr:single-stranded DNA-binding protein [Kiritimatiellia bacterium]
MANLNHVVLAGNLTRDPEVRQLPSGTSVADMGLAVTERFKKQSGEMGESVCFVDVVAWGRQAETCGQYLSKGSPILVEGRLQFDQWESKQGEKRSKLRVRADRVQFLGSPRRDGASADRRVGAPVDEDGVPVSDAPFPADQGETPF